MNKAKVLAGGAAFLGAIAIAATWGPFLMQPYYPTVTFSDDSEMSFVSAGNVPRLVMNTYVQDIKSGDTVRVVYANGDVYDFETLNQCAYARSVSCTLGNPVKKDGTLAQAKAKTADLKYARSDTCPWDSGYKTFKTGYWTSSTFVSGIIVKVVSWWQDTGDTSVYIKGAGCK